MKRRNFVIGCGAGIALSALNGVQSFAYAPSHQQEAPSKEIFVFLFLRGGMDALNFLAPVSDSNYIQARAKGLRIEANEGLALKNGLGQLNFQLHPKAKALKELYDSKDLAFIHACGLPNGTRSHFDAMNLIERGIVEKQGASEGWLARYLKQADLGAARLPALALSGNLSLAFLGSPIASAIQQVDEFDIQGDARLKGILKHLYKGDGLLERTAQRSLETIKYVQAQLPRQGNNKPKPYKAEHGVEYPTEWYIKGFSDSMKNLARLIKMDLGAQVATIDYGGWDTHENQQWVFPKKVEALSRVLAAFYNDLSNYHQRLTVVAMSEFGRRLRSNKSMGTDHGYGGLAMVLGGKVNGGRMYGDWPGLANEQLDNRVDLKVTTDYRQILGEVMQKRFGQRQLDTIFPSFTDYKGLGFLKG